VGGGLSGLALADRLERVGADCLLVKARDRLGGRFRDLTQEIGSTAFGSVRPNWLEPETGVP
jgi:monoamine oxidase